MQKKFNSGLGRAIFESLVGKYSAYAVQLITLGVYARLFTPLEFGNFAVLFVFLNFFFLLAESGVGVALINKIQLSRNELNGVFFFTLLLGIGFSIISAMGLRVFSSFYSIDYSQYTTLIVLIIIIYSITTVPMSSYNREKKFITIGKITVLSELLTLAAIYLIYPYVLALQALILKVLIFASLRFIFLYLLSSNTVYSRPKFSFDFTGVGRIISFSMYQLGFNFVNFFSRNLDNLLVGKFLGNEQLGYYEKAYALMMYPLQLLSFAIAPAIQPVFSENKERKTEMAHKYLELIAVLAIIAVCCSHAMYWLAKPIIFVLLGEQWLDASAIIQLLALSIPIQVICSTTGAIFQAYNKTNVLFYVGLATSITSITSIIIAIVFGDDVLAVALGVIISFHVNFFIIFTVLFRTVLKANLLDLYKALFPAIFIMTISVNTHFFLLVNVDEQINFTHFLMTLGCCVILMIIGGFMSKPARKLIKGIKFKHASS